MKLALLSALTILSGCSAACAQAPATPTPAKPLITPAASQLSALAAQLTASPAVIFRRTFAAWSQTMQQVWANPQYTPPQVVAALGTNAGSLFARSAELAAFLEAESPGCTAPVVALTTAYTVTPNSDGTVTLTKH